MLRNRRLPIRKRFLLLAAVLLSSTCFATVALAGNAAIEDAELWADVSEEINETRGYEDIKNADRKWAVSVGVAARVAPDYEGSNDYGFGFGPNISAVWRDTIFYKGRTLGANLIRKENFKAGVILAKASGRDEDDNDKLEGLGDVDGGIEAGGFVFYKKKPWRFKAEARQEVNSGHDGALVELSAGSKLPFAKTLIFIELGTTWASDNYMKSFFGIDSQQSASSGLERHRADAGIKDINISVSAGYPITNRWRIGMTMEYKKLLGDAADSPIVDDKNQFVAGIGLSYHMGSKSLPEELE